MTSKRLILKHRVVRYITLIFCAPMYMCLIIFYHGLIPELIFAFFIVPFLSIQKEPERKKTYRELQEEEKARKASIASGGEVRTILFFEYIIVFKKFNLNYFYVLKTVGFCRKYYVFKPNLRAFQTENFKPKQKKECVKCCTFSFNQLKSLFEIAFQFLYHNNLSGIANSSVKF